MQWAARFRGGDFRIAGFFLGYVDLSIGPILLRVGAGEVEIVGNFVGREGPQIRWLEIRATRLECASGDLGSCVRIQPQRISWEGGELAWLKPLPLHELGYECLGALSDLRVELSARACAPWQLKLGGGLSLDIRRDALVELKGATRGDAAKIQLCEPVEISCEDVTVQLGSGQFSCPLSTGPGEVDGGDAPSGWLRPSSRWLTQGIEPRDSRWVKPCLAGNFDLCSPKCPISGIFCLA